MGEQGFYEKAVKILEDVKERNPTGQQDDFVLPLQHSEPCSTDAALVDAELSRLRIIDNQREKANKQKLKGKLCFLSITPLFLTALTKQDF